MLGIPPDRVTNRLELQEEICHINLISSRQEEHSLAPPGFVQPCTDGFLHEIGQSSAVKANFIGQVVHS